MMKDFSVLVTPESNLGDLRAAIQSRLAHVGYLSAHDQLVLDDLFFCVDDYNQRSRDLGKAGTVIRIEKTFRFTFAKIVIRLLAPDTRRFVERLLDKVRGNI